MADLTTIMPRRRGARETVERLLARADIQVDGSRPWDLQVHDSRLYSRLLAGGSLALGESYMDGWWDAPALDQFIHRLIEADLSKQVRSLADVLPVLWAKLFNLQTRSGSTRVARQHYALSPELYISFLDPYNQYTCGYFKDTDDLNTAQEQKLDLICRKLGVKAGDAVLDIGCGWGGFAKFAAERYGAHVTGITISSEQAEYARALCSGLPVEIVESDYRDVHGAFDKALVCGMIEHVGHKNYRTLMKVVRGALKEDGLFLLHTIGRNISSTSADPWIARYIFPNSMLPSAKQLTRASEGVLVLEDWHNFGAYYDKTLMAWHHNFVRNWDTIKDAYDERFRRMWEFYLLSCAGAFRSTRIRLWQAVFSKNGVSGGYQSVR